MCDHSIVNIFDRLYIRVLLDLLSLNNENKTGASRFLLVYIAMLVEGSRLLRQRVFGGGGLGCTSPTIP